jgi:hypothetical protein
LMSSLHLRAWRQARSFVRSSMCQKHRGFGSPFCLSGLHQRSGPPRRGTWQV